jgi:hypothetical protein
MDTIISDISHDFEELSNKKNINDVSKLHASIQTKIKNVNAKVQTLRTKFETDDVKVKIDMTEEDYEKMIAKLSGSNVEKVLNSPDLEFQIDEYKKLATKIKSLIHYLENKKLKIVECDKEEHSPEQEPEPETKSVKKKSCQKKAESDNE